MNKIAIYLNHHLNGNVFDKDSILEAYSTDRSLLKIKPKFVAIPENTSDIRKLVRFASELEEKNFHLPIAVRGSGLCRTGADLTNGLVISTEKLTHIRELDAHDRLVHVQAGVTLGKLNSILAPHGLVLPIHEDPRETIGGLIANAPRDNYSKHYGGIMKYVDRIEVVLSNGELVQTARLSSGHLNAKKQEKTLESEIYARLDKLISENNELISSAPDCSRLGYPALKHIKRSGGHLFDLLPAFYGSEGSIGIITEVILHAEILPPRSHRMFALFNTIKSAQEFADSVEKLSPLSVEIFDTGVFKLAEESGKRPELLSRKFEDNNFVVLVAFNDKPSKSRRKIHIIEKDLPKSAYASFETDKNSEDFDEFSSTICAYLNDTGSSERPSLLNDFYVPKENLVAFFDEIQYLSKKYKKKLDLYGCYSTSNYSVRPDFNLAKMEERRDALTLLRDFNEALIKYGGSLAGGLPEGRLKSLVLYPSIDEEEEYLFRSVKDIFDHNGIFTSGSKTDYNTRDTIKHLRIEPNTGINS